MVYINWLTDNDKYFIGTKEKLIKNISPGYYYLSNDSYDAPTLELLPIKKDDFCNFQNGP